MAREFPPPPNYFREVFRISRDEIRARQDKRFLETVARGGRSRSSSATGAEWAWRPGDIRSLDDLPKLPPYTVNELRESIEPAPPFGDFMGVTPADGARMPLVLQTSGGTTGLPRPMLYAPRDRETMAILGGRRFALHGVRPGDRVMVTYSLGLGNGGMAPREAIWRYSGAVPVMTGSGASTPTRRQIEIDQGLGHQRDPRLSVLPAPPRIVARDEMGIDPHSLGIRTLGSHLGQEDRERIEELWNAPCHDAYGTHESGMMAAECGERTGMHIQEDAVILEIADPDTGQVLPEGQKGSVYITTLYRWGAPQIRFNINDISRIIPGDCACGGTMKRLDRIFGRNDTMVKLRGVNVFPEAVGATWSPTGEPTADPLLRRPDRRSAHRHMDVWVEVADPAADQAAFHEEFERRLKEVLGVKVQVTPVNKGDLDRYTGTASTSKVLVSA